MSCCGGGCCWWQKKPPINPHPPPIHSPPPPINPPPPPPSDPCMPSTVEIGDHEPSSSSPTQAEVLKSFEEADIDKADDFINAIQEQLEVATAHKNAQDVPSTSSSNTDKLSNWASFTQSGATFLKFASDHTEKIHTKGNFSQSGEVTKIVGDILQQIGHLHWAVAVLSIAGYLVSKCQEVSENRAEYVDFLKEMLKLASHIKRLNNLSLENGNKEVLKNSFQYIVEGSIFCASQLDSGIYFSFLKSSINSGTLSGIRSKIDSIYQNLQLIAGIETLEQQPTVLPLSQTVYPKNAVGLEEQVEAINTLLNMNKNEDCLTSAVVIWGLGGIGKTILAQAVVSTVNRESYNYARIELDQVSDKNNYKIMQQQILKDAFPSYNGGKEVILRDDSDGRDKLTEAFQSERNKPVFLFIDNALHKKDLEKILPEDLRSLPQRSRILVTTRILTVTNLLQERGLQRKDYPVKTLSDNHAAEVLCSDPAIRDGIKDDIEKMLKLCNGIPLVLKMVGAHLRKQKYKVDRCTQMLGALQSGGKIKENDLSNRMFDFVYEKLDESTKDICCFFDKGFSRRIAEYIVGAEEIAFLQEAALITTVIGNPPFLGRLEKSVDPEENPLIVEALEKIEFERRYREEVELLSVHDIIRSIGRSLSKPSRITDLKSWSEAEKDESKLKGIKGIWLKNEDCVLEKRHINLMEDTLRILVWTGCSINVSGTDAVRFPELRYMRIGGDICWVNVEALDKLAVLECLKLPINKQRGPLKLPNNLRCITVQKQPAVKEDFVPNSSLEELDITFEFEKDGGVTDNSENAFYSRLHGLNKLKTLRVERCYSLCELNPQDFCGLSQLNQLFITTCFNLERLPEPLGQLKSLTNLNLSWCTSLKEWPESFGQLKNLTNLNLSGCQSLKELPESFGQLKSLTNLDLSRYTSLKELPESFGQLKSLTHLDLSWCTSLKELPESFRQLKSLTNLNLSGCQSLKELPESFRQLKSLTHLDLSRYTSLKELPESFEQLKSLTHLDLSRCTSLKELPESFGQLKSLTHLDLSWCTSLKELPESFGQLKSLTNLNLSGCQSLNELSESFGQLKSLTNLNLSGCQSLNELPESFGQLKSLTHLDLSRYTSLKELPESFEQLKSLTHLDLSWCTSLKELPASFEQLKSLTHLDLSWCTSLKELPESFGQLKSLTNLNLSGCQSLNELPESFGQLKSLTNLNLSGCQSLNELPESFGQLKSLTNLNLSGCQSLNELPESFGQLRSLTHLDLSE
ncbi:hypothetical protein SUGI_0455180 [Cryptomeria japonica]|nr:hypothetical protein SUGI_0455180 [Cryptomeria japonica]